MNTDRPEIGEEHPPTAWTGADLVAYWQKEGLIGTHPSIQDPSAYARELRERAESRSLVANDGGRHGELSSASALGPFSLDRAVRAVELVRQRLLRSTAALEAARIPYAVAGGHAVALWVSRVDAGAVRNTADVDLLVRREDLSSIAAALAGAGFVHRHLAGIDVFLDGPAGKPRDGIHLIYEGETVRPGEPLPNPAVADSTAGGEFQVLNLRPLVQIKLTAYRDKDRTHLRDLLDVGLIDDAWLPSLPAELAGRLQALIDTPGG